MAQSSQVPQPTLHLVSRGTWRGTTNLPDEVSPDGLVGEAAAYDNPLSTLLSSKIVGIRLHNFL